MKLWNLCWQTIVNWSRKLLVGYMKEIDVIVVRMVVTVLSNAIDRNNT